MKQKARHNFSEFWIWFEQKQQGPFTILQLQRKGIRPDTLVWNAGLPDWTEARDVSTLVGMFVDSEHAKAG